MNKLRSLISYQHMFIHELRDTNAIDNEEEAEFRQLVKDAKKEIDDIVMQHENFVLHVCNELGITYEDSGEKEIIAKIVEMRCEINDLHDEIRETADRAERNGYG